MDENEAQQFPDSTLENHLKKALAEVLMLALLSEQEYYIGK